MHLNKRNFLPQGAINQLASLAAVTALFILLSIPNRLDWITLDAFIYFPIELLVLGLLLLTKGLAGRVIRIALTAILCLALLMRAADLISYEILGRPFNLIFDFHLLADGQNVVSGVMGNLASFGIGLLIIASIGLFFWIARILIGRVQLLVNLNNRVSAYLLILLLLIWNLLDIIGWSRTGSFTFDQLVWHGRDTLNNVRDIQDFSRFLEKDTRPLPSQAALFRRLEGKDVFVVFAESYGRVLVEEEPFAEYVTRTLKEAQGELESEGFEIRSAFLKSPVVGGLSWLAHASLLAGVWVDSETRFESLVMSERVTLNNLFNQAGWRTIAAMPGITKAWPEAKFFGYDKIYNGNNFGYKGKPFNWVTMPDQYVLSALQHKERERVNRAPLMVEVALVSSHAPWTPVASLVPWSEIGDGAIFNAQAQSGPTPEEVWRDLSSIRDHYRQTIEYMLTSMVSFVTEFGDDDVVVLLLGDHPPAPMISGDPDTDQVIAHIIASDPKVIEAVSRWEWQKGMLPNGDAPVWRMDDLRDRFIKDFSQETTKAIE